MARYENALVTKLVKCRMNSIIAKYYWFADDEIKKTLRNIIKVNSEHKRRKSRNNFFKVELNIRPSKKYRICICTSINRLLLIGARHFERFRLSFN
jgi:hypothetical protein